MLEELNEFNKILIKKGVVMGKAFSVFDDLTIYTEMIKKELYASGAALVIMQNNKIIHEWYSGQHHFKQGARMIDEKSQFNVYSVRVTYIALAAAISIYEGFINLDDKLSVYLNQYDREILGETTVRHLLTRCSGLKFSEKEVHRIFELGTNIEGKRPDLIAKIVMQATGKTVANIIQERVFDKMGLTHTEWITQGKETLVCDINSPDSYPTLRLDSNIGDERNLYVSARELAFWGNLHLNKGIFNGIRILPKEVIELSTSIQSPDSLPNNLPGFGCFWWVKNERGYINWEKNELGNDLPSGSYQILGASSCSCTVIPQYNAVVVRMYNSLYDNEKYDYVKDIQSFGNLVISTLKCKASDSFYNFKTNN